LNARVLRSATALPMIFMEIQHSTTHATMKHLFTTQNSFTLLAVWLLAGSAALAAEPVKVLDLPGMGGDPAKIDYEALPRLSGKLAVVSAAELDTRAEIPAKFDMHHLRFELHNYLAWHAGKFWCIWSDGPPIEDEPTQEVRYATSDDGLVWSPAKSVTGRPDAPYAFIARGLWVRDGKLLALAAHFKGKGAFGADKELELLAYAWDEAGGAWRLERKLYVDAINNFAPQKLPSGDWIVTRRDSRFNVSMLIGGRTALDDWQCFPLVRLDEVEGFRPDEPIFWQLADGTLLALFRDNSGSQRLFRATSTDEGRTWSRPQRTNFPNATSKLFSLETSRGYRVLISNANPAAGRRELHLSLSQDGRTFTRMARLDVPSPPAPAGLEGIWHKFKSGIASLQYPHAIEHDGRLVIALSRGKKQTEVLHISLEEIDRLRQGPRAR
jgi:hypothetical protein